MQEHKYICSHVMHTCTLHNYCMYNSNALCNKYQGSLPHKQPFGVKRDACDHCLIK